MERKDGMTPELRSLLARVSGLDGSDGFGDWSFESAWPTLLRAFADEGRFDQPWPEDRLVHKMIANGFLITTPREEALFDERIMPLLECWAYVGREAFEIEFTKRRTPGFYDPPPDPLQFQMPLMSVYSGRD